MPRGIQFTNTTPVDAAQITDIVLTQANLSFYNKNKLKQLFPIPRGAKGIPIHSWLIHALNWRGHDAQLNLTSYSEYKLNEGIKPVSIVTILRHLPKIMQWMAERKTACYFLIHFHTINQKIIMKELYFLNYTFMI